MHYTVYTPCLTFETDARDYADAVLDMDDAIGAMILARRNGNLAIRNLGYGPALNIRYQFTPLNPTAGWNYPSPSGYLPNVVSNQLFILPVGYGAIENADYEVVFRYESLSQNRYESKTTIQSKVPTEFSFKRIATKLGTSRARF